MSNQKHTPGPWIAKHTDWPNKWASNTEIRNDKNLLIASVNIGMSDFKANAELIARAPDLLEENERLLGWLWQYREELKSTNVFQKNEAIIGNINKLLNDK